MFRSSLVIGPVFAGTSVCRSARLPTTQIYRSRLMLRLLAGLVLVLCLAPTPAAQPSLPTGYYLEDVAGGARFDAPVATAFLPDGTMFVAVKRGIIWAVRGDARLSTPVIDLQDEVQEGGDRGLLGITLDPDFDQNRYIYLFYVVQTTPEDFFDATGYSRLTRYTVSVDGTTLIPGSRKVLLGETYATGIPACFVSHTGGTVAFGTDGSLFISTGDAGSYNGADAGGLYPDCFGPDKLSLSEDIGAFRAQRLESLAGKILRVDPETGLGLPSNPFYTGNPADNASRVWAYGLRNPFRVTVGGTGSTNPADGSPGIVYVADVGLAEWEELSPIRGGENHGWPCYEGPGPQSLYQNATPATNGCTTVGAVDSPQFRWNHAETSASLPSGRTAKSITGGDIVTSSRYPTDLRDRLIYADFELGWVASAAIDANGDLTDDQLFATNFPGLAQMEVDPTTGFLHLVLVYDPNDNFRGRIVRLRHTSDDGTNNAPVAQAGASPRQGGLPLPVTFVGSASFDPDGDALTYAWDFGDGGSSTLPDPQHTYTTPGVYTARLTVSDPSGATGTTALDITVRDGTAPTAQIQTPAEGATFASGQTIRLVGLATDPDQDDATLATKWDISLTHNAHIHPDDFEGTGTEIDYSVPFHGDAGDAYGVRITFTVTDAEGLTSTAERLVPITAAGEVDVTTDGTPIALVTAPTGLGSRSLSTLSDGITPLPSDTSPTLQYDTYTDGGTRALDWIGYAYPEVQAFTRILFQEGLHYADGGWFETLRVEVFQNGEWNNVPIAVAPVYGGDDGQPFDSYTLSFNRTLGEQIRVIGRPGGSGRYISVAELRVFAEPSGTGALPQGWANTDVGSVNAEGSAGQSGGTFTVRGGGDVWGRADGFHYAYQALSGNGTVTARMTSVAAANSWAKAGLMIRSTTDADAPHAMMIGTPGQGLHFQFRPSAGVGTEWIPGPNPGLPAWLRLTREGSLLTGSYSADGVNWTTLGTATITLPENVLVGLMSSATDFSGRNDVAAAVFTNVTLDRAVDSTSGAFNTDLGILSVYPNPARSTVTTRLQLSGPGTYTLDVLDALGRQLVEQSFTTSSGAPETVSLDLSEAGSGIYVLRLRDETGASSTQRLTVVR